jgi:hypothetical protein
MKTNAFNFPILLLFFGVSVPISSLQAQVELEPSKVHIKTGVSDSDFIRILNNGETTGYDLSLHNHEDFTISETNVSPRLIIKKGGNLGLGGTLNPTAPLHVLANTNVGPDNNGIYLFNPYDSTAQHAILSARVAGTFSGDPFLSFDVVNESGWSVGIDNSDNNKLKFSNLWNDLNGATRMTLQEDGNLGIGTPGPSKRLDVNGQARIRNLPFGFGDRIVADADGNLMRENIPVDVNNTHVVEALLAEIKIKDKKMEELSVQNELLSKRLDQLENKVQKLIRNN